MAQTLTISNECAQMGNAAEFRCYLNDVLGGRDRMDEPRRKVRISDIDAVPIVGPRGGTRPPTFTSFHDDVCEDGDAEDAMIARLDERRAEDDLPEPDEDDGGEDWPLFVAGVPLDEYLAAQEDNWEVAYGVSDDESFSRIAALGWRGGDRNIRRCKAMMNYHHARVVVPHNKPCGKRQRRETIWSRFGGTSVRTEASDRMGDVDPWTVHVALTSEEEERQTSIVRDPWELAGELLGYYDYASVSDDDHEYAAAELREIAEAIAYVDCTDTVRALWVDGRLEEAIGLLWIQDELEHVRAVG